MGSILITNKTRKGADMAALSCLCQSFRELCLLQQLHQQGGVRVKAASAVRKVPIPTHYHLEEKTT